MVSIFATGEAIIAKINNVNDSKVEKFNEWMQEINSIYYANNKAMTNAFNKIYNEEI